MKRGERVESQLLFEPIVNKEVLVNDPHFRPDGGFSFPKGPMVECVPGVWNLRGEGSALVNEICE